MSYSNSNKSTAILAFTLILSIFFFSPVLAQNNQVQPQSQWSDQIAQWVANSIVWTIRYSVKNFVPLFDFFVKWIWPPLSKIAQAILSVVLPGLVNPPTA